MLKITITLYRKLHFVMISYQYEKNGWGEKLPLIQNLPHLSNLLEVMSWPFMIGSMEFIDDVCAETNSKWILKSVQYATDLQKWEAAWQGILRDTWWCPWVTDFEKSLTSNDLYPRKNLLIKLIFFCPITFALLKMD